MSRGSYPYLLQTSHKKVKQTLRGSSRIMNSEQYQSFKSIAYEVDDFFDIRIISGFENKNCCTKFMNTKIIKCEGKEINCEAL
jgi:hypothetical protein